MGSAEVEFGSGEGVKAPLAAQFGNDFVFRQNRERLLENKTALRGIDFDGDVNAGIGWRGRRGFFADYLGVWKLRMDFVGAEFRLRSLGLYMDSKVVGHGCSEDQGRAV